MKPLYLLFCALSFSSLSAHAENVQRLSAKEWATTWARSQTTEVQLNTNALEKTYLYKCSDCENKENLKKARQQFAKGEFENALTNYNLVPRGDTYWLTAVEEKGWAYFQQENYEKALAQTKTLLAPQFAEIVNTEAFLLQALTQLKICDYKGVFETNTIFKEKQKKRILEVQSLAQSGWNDSLETFLKKVDQFPLTLDDMGEALQHLPLLIYKDIEFQKQSLRYKISERALQEAKANKASGALVKNIDQLKERSLSALKSRVQELAQTETNANFKVIQKLNLVEVEAIQRIHTDLNLSEDLYKKGKFQEVSEDKLVFMDDGKPWIDELDKFEVSAKSCTKGIRRKM
ncbi:MAG: tetratricopeptide repeat protein [Pseudobdellovibrionaceae bacterium]